MPASLAVPIGTGMRMRAQKGERVRAGQVLASAEGRADVCAPASGIVGASRRRALARAGGGDALCVDLQEAEEASASGSMLSGASLPADEFLRHAGIVGLGGGGMDACRKYRAGLRVLLVNAVESDDSICCDRALLEAHADSAAADACLVAERLGAACAVLAVRHDAPCIEGAAGARIARVQADYAAGAERRLIREVCDIAVPSGALPADYGVLSFNLGTVLAIARAVQAGAPMTSRVLTAYAGRSAINIRAPFGASLSDVARFVGAPPDGAFAARGAQQRAFLLASSVVCAQTTAVDCAPLPAQKMAAHAPCIRCGDCVAACPESLSPMRLFALWEDGDAVRMRREERLHACILCRRCDEVCPSGIPLADSFEAARTKLRTEEDASREAARLRLRHELRARRLASPSLSADLRPAELAARARRRAARRAGGSQG